MESLADTKWDVVIYGTGLQHSLLALALSRSDKKILHVDPNEYYGGSEAAFSLQEVDEWVAKLEIANATPFQNAKLWKAESNASGDTQKLSSSRAYTLTLSPQIIYTKSKLLAQLVSSQVYRQLEFQAVGNWWIYDGETALLKRLPNGREDVFQDKNIDNRAKRSLMKFLKFVVDYENQMEVWLEHTESSLQDFLSSKFQFPAHLQTVISALTLSLEPSEYITVGWALPRIARHLMSIGMFGPGFNAVYPKWGGGAEIAQVACRSGAVGGSVYVLGTSINNVKIMDSAIEDDGQSFSLSLSNGETVRSQRYIHSPDNDTSPGMKSISKIVAVVSSRLPSIFASSVEGSPLAAVSVVVFPPNTLQVAGAKQSISVYIIVHSGETGECPAGQCVLYATTAFLDTSKTILEAALSAFINATESEAKILYQLYYEQIEDSTSSLDLAFDDGVLERVEKQWRKIMSPDEPFTFLHFEERNGINADDDENDDY